MSLELLYCGSAGPFFTPGSKWRQNSATLWNSARTPGTKSALTSTEHSVIFVLLVWFKGELMTIITAAETFFGILLFFPKTKQLYILNSTRSVASNIRKCPCIVFAQLPTGEDAASSLYTLPCCHPLIVLPRRPRGRDALVLSALPRCLRHGSTCPARGDPHLTTSCQTRPAAGRASAASHTHPVRKRPRRGSHPAGSAQTDNLAHSCVSLTLQECAN